MLDCTVKGEVEEGGRQGGRKPTVRKTGRKTTKYGWILYWEWENLILYWKWDSGGGR